MQKSLHNVCIASCEYIFLTASLCLLLLLLFTAKLRGSQSYFVAMIVYVFPI